MLYRVLCYVTLRYVVMFYVTLRYVMLCYVGVLYIMSTTGYSNSKMYRFSNRLHIIFKCVPCKFVLLCCLHILLLSMDSYQLLYFVLCVFLWTVLADTKARSRAHTFNPLLPNLIQNRCIIFSLCLCY
jgi:hypothetical protein